MTDFIKDLEFSVRAGNVLRNMGIDNLDAFMALTEKQVMAEDGAGAKTWREVAETQSYFRHLAEYAHALACQGAKEKAQALRSKRDELALAVLPKVVDTCAQDTREPGETHEQMLARKAYALADAMLAARETKET